MSQRNAATMKDVAARAGVSLTTVSRAFAAPEKISPETMRRIEQAIGELDYTVNLNARSLRNQSSGVAIVLIPDIGNPFFSVLLQAIEEQARSVGKAVLIGDTGKDRDLAETYARHLDARRADGMILLNGFLPYKDDRTGRDGRLPHPIVAVSERIPHADVPTVGIDNVQAAVDAVIYLIRSGHRRIAHITGPLDNVLTDERQCGYRRALEQAGCGNPNGYVQTGDFSIRSGRAAMARILGAEVRPTAVFASNDEMAIGAIIEAKAQGLKIPQHLSVVGFDDIDFAQNYDPPLSTVYQPRRDMGRSAMQLLSRLMADPAHQPDNIVLDHKLVIRASSGPV